METANDVELTPGKATALDPGKASELRFRQISCAPCAKASFTQTDCIMFGLDERGQVWQKRLQDSKWRKAKMTPAEGSDE